MQKYIKAFLSSLTSVAIHSQLALVAGTLIVTVTKVIRASLAG